MILQRLGYDIALTILDPKHPCIPRCSASAVCVRTSLLPDLRSKGVGISGAVIGKVRVSNSAGCCRTRGIGDRPCGRRTDGAGRPVSDLTASRHGHSVLNVPAAGYGET